MIEDMDSIKVELAKYNKELAYSQKEFAYLRMLTFSSGSCLAGIQSLPYYPEYPKLIAAIGVASLVGIVLPILKYKKKKKCLDKLLEDNKDITIKPELLR